jgi:membrane-associated phospholipid phosphatase
VQIQLLGQFGPGDVIFRRDFDLVEQLVERRAGPVFARLRRVLIIQPYGPFTEHDASLPQRRVIPTQPFRVPEVLPFPSTAPGSGRSTRGEPNVLAAAGRTPTHPTGTLHLMTGREQRLTSVAVIAAVIVVGRTAAIDRVPPLEARIFRAINQLPDRALVFVWLPMQFGSFGAIPVGTVMALLSRRRVSAAAVAAAGTAAYLLAKLVKISSGRPRPADVLDAVRIRGDAQTGGGLPSGHAAVSAALATAWFPHLSSGQRPSVVVLASITAVGRVYVGAHMPLDVTLGSAVGTAVGAIASTVKRHR